MDKIIPDLMKFLETVWVPIVEVGAGLLIGPWVKKLIWQMAKRSQDKGVITFLGSAANITIIVFSLIMAAESLGIRMNSVISLLSALGLGVALALKGNMANVAGGMQILITKPFKVGDYVRIAPHKGVVTAIEIMFVTIRTDNGKEVIIPNATIIEDMVINYSRLPHIRIRAPFAVPIGENYAQLKEEILRLMKENPYFVEGEPFYVTMNGITSSAVEMEVIGQVTVNNLEPCKHWIYEVIATQMEVFNTYDPDQENILILPQNASASNSSPTTPLPLPGALPSTTEGIATKSNSNSTATPLGPLDRDLADRLKNLEEPSAINHMEKEIKSKLLGQLLNKVDDVIIKPDKEENNVATTHQDSQEMSVNSKTSPVSTLTASSTQTTPDPNNQTTTLNSKESDQTMKQKAIETFSSNENPLNESEEDSLAEAIA